MGKSWARNLKAVKQIKPMNEAIINFRKTKNKANVIIAYYLSQKKYFPSKNIKNHAKNCEITILKGHRR